MRQPFPVLVLVLLAMLAQPARADDQAIQQYQTLLTPLLKSGNDVLGQPLVFPAEPADVTAAIVTVAPGAETGWHLHEVPLFAHILEGELTVDYGEKGTKTYRAGDSVLEAMNWPHNGTNTGTAPMRLIAVYMGGGGRQNTVAVPAP